jgi:8-oxo-dGTP pyrophosphatase MutT (NUDIX family)
MSPPRILDPHSVPVVGHDGDLPALPDSQLTAQALRARFASTSAWQPEFNGDGHPHTERPRSQAAVLVPLVSHADGLRVMLTRRAAHLRDHPGQISFPGGRAELHDADRAATALREAEEEVGLPRDEVEVIGQLPPYVTVTHFVVTPVVGLLRRPFAPALDRSEVEEVFEVPLKYLMNPAHHQRHLFSFEGGQRQFLSMPWPGPAAGGRPGQYFIWGATAAMLRNLYRFLAG